MFNCFYSLSRFCSDILDLLICTFDAYFIKLFRISYSYVAKINVYDKIMTENRKMENMWKSKKFYINLHLNDRLHMEFTAF